MAGVSSIGGFTPVGNVVPVRPAAARSTSGRIMFVEDHSNNYEGMFNDGSGSASLDYDTMFDNRPTIRLDPQGNTSSGTTPGISPLTTGVVFKRRINDNFSGAFGAETWVRWTSSNNNTNVFTTVSLYNRDGTNAWVSRFWIDTTAGTDSANIFYLNSAGTYTQLGSTIATQSFTQHQWDPVNGSWDRAGTWHYVKLVTNFSTKQYVSIQFDDVVFPLGGQGVFQLASTGAKTMHFSAEFAQKTATRRFINIGPMIGTLE